MNYLRPSSETSLFVSEMATDFGSKTKTTGKRHTDLWYFEYLVVMLKDNNCCALVFCRQFTDAEIDQIKKTKLADVLNNATRFEILNIQREVFKTSIGKSSILQFKCCCS